MNGISANSSLKYLYEDLDNIYGYIYLSEGTDEEKVNSSKNEIKNFLQMLKAFIKKITNVKGIKELKHIIITLLSSVKLLKFLNILKGESIEEKMDRINSVNKFSDILSVAFEFSNISGKILYKLFNFLYLLNPKNAALHFFQYENKFQDKLQNHNATKIYKYVYDKFVSVGISEKFAAVYICMLAFLSPIYILFNFIKSPKEPSYDDPEFYDNPFLYDETNTKTGFKGYEKMIIKSVNKITDKYQNLESDYDKQFLLSTTILKDFVVILISMAIIFSPVIFKIGYGVDFILHCLNMFLIFFVLVLLFIHFMLTNIALEQINKRYKNE